MEIPLLSAISILTDRSDHTTSNVISCFQQQTYPNKELLLVNNVDTQLEAARFDIDEYQNVKIIDTPTLMQRGAAYNYAVSLSKGQLLAIFDCNCWHAPQRLLSQAMMLNNATASVLNSSLYISEFSQRASYWKSIIPTSLVWARNKNIFPNIGVGAELKFIRSNSAKTDALDIVYIDNPELYCQMDCSSDRVNIRNDGLNTNHYDLALKIYGIMTSTVKS